MMMMMVTTRWVKRQRRIQGKLMELLLSWGTGVRDLR